MFYPFPVSYFEKLYFYYLRKYIRRVPLIVSNRVLTHNLEKPDSSDQITEFRSFWFQMPSSLHYSTFFMCHSRVLTTSKKCYKMSLIGFLLQYATKPCTEVSIKWVRLQCSGPSPAEMNANKQPHCSVSKTKTKTYGNYLNTASKNDPREAASRAHTTIISWTPMNWALRQVVASGEMSKLQFQTRKVSTAW